MIAGQRAPWWAWLFWLLVLAGGITVAAQWVWQRHQSAASQIETVEPRIARLLGLADSRDRLRQAALAAEQGVQRHAYLVDKDASQAGNDAQQRVRDLFSRSGLEVFSLQVLPSRVNGAFDRVPIAARVEGDLATLQTTLAAMASMSPSVFVEGFALQGASANESSSPRAVAELQLFVLRLRP